MPKASTGVAASERPHRELEEDRFAAALLAQLFGLLPVGVSHWLLYAWSFNSIGLGILMVAMITVIVGLIFTNFLYRGVRGLGFSRPRRPSRIPVNEVIMTFAIIDVIGLYFLVRWSIAPHAYLVLFPTLIAIAIILRAPARFVSVLVVSIAIVYGAALVLPPRSIASPIGPMGQTFYLYVPLFAIHVAVARENVAHLTNVLVSLAAIWVEYRVMLRAEEKSEAE